MFKLGHRVAVTEAYGEPDFKDLMGTIIYIDNTVWPITVNMDIVAGKTEDHIYRTALFERAELRLVDNG